jgi:3-oxoacyl-[acyl-carrier-protein] synthase I
MSVHPPAIADLLAWEAVTSLGECAAETSLLWEAGIVNLSQSRFVLDDGTRVTMCSQPSLPPDMLGLDRLAALSDIAIQRLACKVEESTFHSVVPLLLCLPDRLAAHPNAHELNQQGKALVNALAHSFKLLELKISIEAFPFGRASGALAMHRATELVAKGQLVLWGGVDSQYDWDTLQALSNEDRLVTSENVDGIRPGEGAAFVLLTPAASPMHPKVLGLGLGRQDRTKIASRADGLARAIRIATSPLRNYHKRCSYWLTDRTHEAVTTQSLQHVLTACGDVVGKSTTLHAPLQALGDVGAATLPLFATLASEAWMHGSADDDTALLAACSNDGACGAFLLCAPSAGRLT